VIDFSYQISGQEHGLGNVALAMRGPHQAVNAAIALATVVELRHQGWCVSADAARIGLGQATLPARVELIAGEPTVVLDVAHNPASARALIEALAELPRAARRTLVVSISCDKDLRAIVRELVPYFDRFLATQYQENPRAMPADALAQMIREELARNALSATQVRSCPIPGEAWRLVNRSAVPDELVCITGSFFLAADMKEVLRNTNRDIRSEM